MIRNFISIEEMNVFYANSLSELAQNAKNVNDDVLQVMVSQMMQDYQNNLNLLNLQLKFEKKEYKLRKRQEQKDTMQLVKFELKKLKHMYWERWKSNRKLFKLFKKQFKVSVEKDLKEEEFKLEDMKKYISLMKENRLKLTSSDSVFPKLENSLTSDNISDSIDKNGCCDRDFEA